MRLPPVTQYVHKPGKRHALKTLSFQGKLPFMNAILTGIRRFFSSLWNGLRALWRRFRQLRPRTQLIIGVLIIIALIALMFLTGGGAKEDTAGYQRTVTLASVSSLSGGGSSGNVIGTVRSITEAELLAQTGGTVRRVNASVGSSVGAGSVLAELENASERAAVLQAEGSYDAAVAANVTTVRDVSTDIRTSYNSSFSELETTLQTDVDSFFGAPTAAGPNLIINADGDQEQRLSGTRRDISDLMNAWRRGLPESSAKDPNLLLKEMESTIGIFSTFLTDLADAANARDSGASAAQLAGLATARATIASISSEIASLRNDFEAQKASAASGTPTANEASVKQALGSLRLAQAALEKTVVRAPIGGTVNFLPIRVGDYVTAFTHVATVAQNGALEIVAYVSEDERAALAVGDRVMVEETLSGIVTSIAPALDPVTKQIEIHVAVEGADTLVNGQSVRIAVPAPVSATAQTGGTVLLPLSAVKLYADSRVVFTVDGDGRLVARAVEIGEVRGDRIEVLSGLTPDLRIVTDARGLAEGQKVKLSNGS